jgi:hypothetical protein
LVSKPGTALTSADWRTVFPVAARVYGIVSRADVLLNGPGGLGSATYRMLSQRLMGQALEVIRNSVERRALKEIPLLEFTDILWQVKDHNWLTLPDSFGRTPEDFSRSMFLFWGGVTHAMTGRAIRVVNLEVLDRIQALSDAVHQSIEVLAPYWPLTEENLANLDSNQIQQAARALESAGRLLAGAFSPAQPAGDEFLELPSLVSMIVPAHLRTRLDWQVVQQIRSLILPRAQSGVAPGDWQRLAEVASRVWSLVLWGNWRACKTNHRLPLRFSAVRELAAPSP